MPRTTEECGCKHDGSEWLFLCEPCKTDYDARHAQAAADYREQENRRDGAAAFRRLF